MVIKGTTNNKPALQGRIKKAKQEAKFVATWLANFSLYSSFVKLPKATVVKQVAGKLSQTDMNYVC